MQVWIQDWEESDSGWTSSDGVSMHEKRRDVHNFIQDYWDDMPLYIPDTYSRPFGLPYETDAEPGYEERLKASKNGIRLYGVRFNNS